MNEEQKHFREVVRAYHTDCALHPGGWGEELVPLWQNQVIRQRLEMIDNGGWNKATDAEVAIYLSAASGIAPFDRDWTDIFVYEVSLLMGNQIYDALGKNHCPRCRAWEATCDGNTIKCLKCGYEIPGVSWNRPELTDYQKMEVNHLKHQIREKQIKAESKGGPMQKNKILIEEREDGTLIGISRDGVDPYVKKVNLTWEQTIGQLPFLKGMTEIAEEQWKLSPKNPSYAAPPKPEVKKVEAKAVPKKGGKKAPPAEQKPLVEPATLQEPATKQEAPTQPEKEIPASEPGLISQTPDEKTPTVSPVTPVTNEPSEVVVKEVKTEPAEKAPEAPKTRTSADTFQYKLKDGRGPFADVQAAMDALGLDKATRPNHNRYDRLSKKLQEEIIREAK